MTSLYINMSQFLSPKGQVSTKFKSVDNISDCQNIIVLLLKKVVSWNQRTVIN